MEHFLNTVIGRTAEFFQNSEVEFIDVDQEGDKAWTSPPSPTDSPKPPDSPRAALTTWIPLAALFSSNSSSKRDELEPIVEEESCVGAKGHDGVCTQEQPPLQLAPRASVVELQPGVRQYHYGPLKYDYDSPEDTGQKKSGERKERRMSFQKPKGMMEYTAGAQDTLNSIALKFDTTPNELVQLNKLFSRMIVPGQMLYCPDPDYMSSEGSSPSVSPVSPLSPTSSEAEFEKLQDMEPATQRPSERPAPATSSPNPARSARVVSSTSEEEEALSERFLKINCKYITNGKGVVGGVLLVTPNNIMFDPHKLDPLVVENGCEEYGIICPMDEVISAAMYHDIVNTKIKDVTPMPEEWVNLALGKKTTSSIRPHGEERESRLVEAGNDSASTAPKSTEESLSEEVFTESELSPIREEVASSDELEQSSRSAEGLANSGSDKTLTASEPPEPCAVSAQDEARTTGDSGFVAGHSQDAGDASLGGRDPNSTESQGSSSDTTTQTTCHEVSIEADGDGWKPCDHLDGSEKAKDERASAEPEAGAEAAAESEPNASVEKEPEKVNEGAKGVVGQTEELEELRKMWKSHTLQHTREQRDNIQHADVFSSEKRVKKAVMFLCLRVGKPMMKTFVSHAQASMQQYAQKDTEPEYWFAVPQERADHLFAFFVQWSPELYGVEGDEPGKEPGFVVVEKSEESDMIDDVYDEASGKEWEIVTADEAKRQHGPVASTTDLGPEAWKPVLNSSSSILEQDHINKLAANLPPRTVGYPWTLAYSTSKHGMSLKTLYRTMVGLDSPMLLVIKDTDRQIFGALSSDPFKVSDHFYGTGETFLFTFNPEYQCYKWTGDNLFFIKGDMDSLAIGGGSGQFGLWLDEDLYHGRSHFCKTFNNETLSKKEDFFIQEVEVWLFE
ncbi:oxidation resistance protein 1-like isoform X2 [Petromyzon marinus]|uniref:Oxidation resistance protein 1 n=1 Tax=Petromyzon marinus TaxID=7757 RepID=A0AAJ7T043_PETMA|nr:oxidation resistance protein 1-like isoform X2 [Petromyzon marinus]